MSDSGQPPATPRMIDALTKHWAWEREARLGAGIVLFVFVTMHLLNHALGVFGVAVMEAVQRPRMALWQSVPGTLLLYGAFFVHIVLALKRMARRRFSRLPPDEALQIALGVLIPFLIIDHVVGTRGQSLLGYPQDYRNVLLRLWGDPAIKQTALVICAWTHGCIGIGQTFRGRSWYVRWRDPLMVFAGLLPLLALAGFVSAAREVEGMALQTRPLTRADYFELLGAIRWSLAIFIAGLLSVLAIVLWRIMERHRSGLITIKYIGHGSVQIGRGTTVLEASRINGIPHPAICGGRGRCSTCRVAVIAGVDDLPSLGPTERAMLQRISAPPNVRLGCQLRPTSNLAVQILLPILPTGGRLTAKDEAYRWGVERNVTVLFVDIRAFNTLARKQLPYDLVLLLNRFIGEMTQAATAHGGRVDSFMADGLMAIFGLGSTADAGAREAVLAARAMMKVVEGLNREFGAALPIPLRVGIGIHTGPAIIAQIGDAEHGVMMTALGETVTIASRLESATKDYLTDVLVSAQTAKASGLDLPRYESKRLHIRGREEPIILHVLSEKEQAAKPAKQELPLS